MSEVDRLEVKVEAQARGANSQLDTLVRRLSAVKSELGSIDASAFVGMANGVSRLASAMLKMNTVKTTDFTRLARNVQSMGSMNVSNLYSAASAISMISKSFDTLGSVSNNAQSVADLAKGISKLGNKNVTAAIVNIPHLSSALKQMMQTLSGAPVVSSNVIQMTNAMASLAANGSRVASTTKNLSTGFKQYTESTRKAKESSRSLAYYAGKLYANYFMVIRAVKGLSNALTSSMDYIEEYNYYNVTMGKVASEWSNQWEQYGYDSAESYASSFQGRVSTLLGKMSGYSINTDGTLTDMQTSNLGLDVTALTNYSAGLMQVTNSLGLTGEASVATTKAMAMLAGDMSSFRNLDLSTVMTNFQSGLIGQSRALYKYGIDITNATLANYAYELGVSKAVSEMSQAEKMQLRMIAILDQSKTSWGDLANTINSPSNQLRLLKNNFTALSRTIGNIFLPVVAKVLPYINGLTIAVRRLFEWVGSLLGIDLSGIISNSSAGYSDAFADIVDDADDTSSAIDGATNSAKALKNELMGFDEINKLSDISNSSSSGSSSGGAGNTVDLTNQLNAALADYEKVWNASFDSMSNTANKYADDISGFFQGIAKYAEPSVEAVKNLWDDGLSKYGNFQSATLKDFYENFLKPLGKWTLGKGVPEFFNITNDLLTNINYKKLRDSLDNLYGGVEQFAEIEIDGLLDFYKYFLVPIGKWTFNAAIPRLADAIADLADNVSWKMLNSSLEDFWRALSRFGTKTGDGLVTFFQAMAKVGSVTIGALAHVIEAFAIALDMIPEPILKIAGAEIGAIATAFLLFKAATGISSIITSIGSALETLLIVIMVHPVAAAVTLLSGLAIGLVSIFSTADDAEKSSVKISDAVQSVVDSANNAVSSFNDTKVATEGTYEATKNIAEAYFDLAKRSDTLNDSETQLMASYKSMLEDTCPELISILDDSTLSFEEQEKQVYSTIAALKKYALQAAMEDVLKDLYKEQAKVTISLRQNQSEYKRAEEQIYSYLASLSGLTVEQEKASYEGLELSEVLRGTNQKLGDVCASTGWTVEAVKRLEQENSSLKTSQNDVNSTIGATTDYLSEVVTSMDSTGNKSEETGGRIAESTANAVSSSKGSLTSLLTHSQSIMQMMSNSASGGGNAFANNYRNAISTLRGSISNTFFNIAESMWIISESRGISAGQAFVDSFRCSIENGRSAIQQALMGTFSASFEASLSTKSGYKSGVSGLITTNIVPRYATGGYPAQGQYFLARESGPELVGSIGNRTAVANNDQITTSITNAVAPAVYNAVVSAMSEYGGGTPNVQVFVGGKEITDVVVRDINNTIATTGVCPIDY